MLVMEIIDVLDPLPRGNGHGGARRGSGRKPDDYVKPPEVQDYDRARARHEQAKAEHAELDLEIKRGAYIPRAAVRQACATAMQSMAQTLRSIPDNVERRLGVSPDVAEAIGLAIDEALNGLADEFALMSGDTE